MYAHSSLVFSGNFSQNTQAYFPKHWSQLSRSGTSLRLALPDEWLQEWLVEDPSWPWVPWHRSGLDVVFQQLGHVHKLPFLDLCHQFGRNRWKALANNKWLGMHLLRFGRAGHSFGTWVGRSAWGVTRCRAARPSSLKSTNPQCTS